MFHPVASLGLTRDEQDQTSATDRSSSSRRLSNFMTALSQLLRVLLWLDTLNMIRNFMFRN